MKSYYQIFYYTVLFLNWCTTIFIHLPFITLARRFKVSEKKIKYIEQNIFSFNSNDSTAFKWMLWSLTFLILSIEFIVAKCYNPFDKVNLSLLFIMTCIFSVLFNHLVLWQTYSYKKHFVQLKKEKKNKFMLFITVFFHLTPFIFIATIFINS